MTERRRPLCEVKNCPNEGIQLWRDPTSGVAWLVCAEHLAYWRTRSAHMDGIAEDATP